MSAETGGRCGSCAALVAFCGQSAFATADRPSEQARQRCWRYSWVLDLDIRSFFGSLDHSLMMRAVQRFTDERWVRLYVERWLKASVQRPDGRVEPRVRGTPQGGLTTPPTQLQTSSGEVA
jgi:hypothetical protein